MGFFSMIVLSLGKAGKWAVWKKDAGFTYRMFKKSLIMLIPFLMIVFGLKQQGHRMKDIMEYFKQNSDVSGLDQIDPLHRKSDLIFCANENQVCDCEVGSNIYYG